MSLTTNQKLVSVFTVLTALMHLAFSGNFKGALALGFDLQILFILNGIGYLGLLVLLYFIPAMESNRSLIRYALIGFTLVTILGWVLFHPGETLLDQSLANKVIEVLLIVFAVRDMSDN